MKKLRFYLLASLLLTFSVTAFAEGLPSKVETTFKKMYPKASDVEWEQIGESYVAEFVMNNNEVDVWINTDGQWIMTSNDVESLEKIPDAVRATFMKSDWASMKLRDVRIVSFPNHSTVILIEVEEYNSDEEYHLFYATDGELIKKLNVSELGGEIYPELFFGE